VYLYSSSGNSSSFGGSDGTVAVVLLNWTYTYTYVSEAVSECSCCRLVVAVQSQ